MQLTINHVSYRYPGASNIALTDISATFPKGWTGLVGDNGCGKSTLAMIAAGLLVPLSGTTTPALLSSYCPQDSSIEPLALFDFATDWGSEAVGIRNALAIDDDWPWRFHELSGGQQKRLQIACSLWQRPDLLVVDEPTNDLDIENRKAVANALADFKGVGLLISHDRALLNRLVGQCLVFQNGAAIMRPGGYGRATAQAQEEMRALERRHEQAKREVSRIQSEALRRNEEAQRSKKRLSARNVGKHDNSMREKLGRAKVSSKDAVAGRASAAMASRLESAQAKLADALAPKRYDYEFTTLGEPLRGNTLCHVDETLLHRGDFSLFVPELWVAPTDHIGIVGQNGAGKSTLVQHLLGLITEGARVGFIPQDVSPQQRDEALGRLRNCSQKDKGSILAHVARLNSNPSHVMDGIDVSPGEMRKLLLAELLLEQPHVLVLDEPTNHLDVGSIEALQGLLRSFAGAVVLISHDDALVRESCNVLWQLEPQGPTGSFAVRPAPTTR